MLFPFLLGNRVTQLYHGSRAISMTWHYFICIDFMLQIFFCCRLWIEFRNNKMTLITLSLEAWELLNILHSIWIFKSIAVIHMEIFLHFFYFCHCIQCKFIYYRALNKNHVNKNQMMSWAAWYKLFHYILYLFY